MSEAFCWHPQARLTDTAGQVWLAPLPCNNPVIDDAAGAAAAALAFGGGLPWRIGAAAHPAPASGPVPAFETLTSGSTGAPRRIRRSQASWIASFAVNAGLFGIGPGVQVAVLGRLAHSLALYGVAEALHLGATAHVLAGARPDRQRRLLAKRRITVLYATPTQLRLLAEAPGPALPDLARLLVGGSKLDPALRAALAELAPAATVQEFYGAAEASFIALADAETPSDAVGRPYPGVMLDLAEGQEGPVCLTSPYLAEAYASDPGAAVWKDDWLTLPEIATLRGGYLYLRGRTDRMVTVADQNVFPEEIEAFLLTLPGVARAAVLPRPDTLRGAVLVAILSGETGQTADITHALRREYGPTKAPAQVIWRSDWPMLPGGKTDLAALAAETGGAA